MASGVSLMVKSLKKQQGYRIQRLIGGLRRKLASVAEAVKMVGDSGRQTVVSNGFSKIAAGSISGETQDDARNTDPVLQPHRRDRCNGAAGRDVYKRQATGQLLSDSDQVPR